MKTTEEVIIKAFQKKIEDFEEKIKALKISLAIFESENEKGKIEQPKKVILWKPDKKIKQEVQVLSAVQKEIKKPKKKVKKPKRVTKALTAIDILSSAGKPMKTREIYENMQKMNFPFSPKCSDQVNITNLYMVLKKESKIVLVDRGTWALKS